EITCVARAGSLAASGRSFACRASSAARAAAIRSSSESMAGSSCNSGSRGVATGVCFFLSEAARTKVARTRGRGCPAGDVPPLRTRLRQVNRVRPGVSGRVRQAAPSDRAGSGARAACVELRRTGAARLPAAVGRLVLLARRGTRDQDASLGDRVFLQRDTLLLRLLRVVLAPADVDVAGDPADLCRLRAD